MRAPLLAAILLAAALAGCGKAPDPRADVVPYPHGGDVAVYEATGALLDLSRWENGHAFTTPSAQVRFTVSEGGKMIDAARSVHDTYKVTVDLGQGGGFVKHADLYVSPRHEAIVQSFYPLTVEHSILAFDERGFPWLWGASALFGDELAAGNTYPLPLPDNLGTGLASDLAWRASEAGDAWKLDLEGHGVNATLWMERGSAWPVRVTMAIATPELSPNVRIDGAGPATIDARLVSLTPGAASVPPRDRGAVFLADEAAARAAWDGEKPPDGDSTGVSYPLSEAVRDAKLLDRGLQAWIQGASTPMLYRGTFQVEAGPAPGSTSALWLLQFVDKEAKYYEVQVSKLSTPQLPVGVPRIEKSAPAEAPKNEAQGWFDAKSVPDKLVTLGEGVRIMQAVFGAPQVQVFLRSFARPPGYSYFIDGGFEIGKRYTVVYNPQTGLLEEATGPVSPRMAS